MIDTQPNKSDLKTSILERLELPKAILIQLRETCLFNGMIDTAIEDLDEVIKFQNNR